MTHDDAKRVQLTLEMLPQPDDRTCGPTCLHAVYAFHGDGLPLEQVIREVRQLEDGGTLGVILGEHALRRGYDVSLHTYNLRVFDPTWFALPAEALCAKLGLSPSDTLVLIAIDPAMLAGGRVTK